ncbi:iron chaperone [Sphingomonas aracearum]|uniref:YdhG-like domain-containing protein n=1 Tax=Sphingomonas aracearum TaxID=2283317 RepID=A0A369W102_9SPHN|nr:YdeI/OmpD-associated family protein [Sphingomonas aracearum]RDE07030.1 hypothetical protein DVW87_05075 [Sphingomonas aracearum]
MPERATGRGVEGSAGHAVDLRVDAYIERQADFARPILIELRTRLHAALPGLAETIKWGMPFFVHRGRPLASMAGFRAHASFGFWRRDALSTGREGEAMGQFGRLRSVADLPPRDRFAEMVRTAAALSEAGAPARSRAPREEIDLPADLAGALAADPAAAAFFQAFPPGARRDYAEWVAGAKRPETRARRLADAMRWIGENKRRNWKHERSG